MAAATPPALTPVRMHLSGINLLQGGRLPLIRAGASEVPVVMAQDHEIVIQPHDDQLGHPVELQFADGSVLTVQLPASPRAQEALHG